MMLWSDRRWVFAWLRISEHWLSGFRLEVVPKSLEFDAEPSAPSAAPSWLPVVASLLLGLALGLAARSPGNGPPMAVAGTAFLRREAERFLFSWVVRRWWHQPVPSLMPWSSRSHNRQLARSLIRPRPKRERPKV